jgi:hypothetical protein
MTSYINVKMWRKEIKSILIDILGGKCNICGYDRCIEALDFHHIYPDKKQSSISNYIISGSIDDCLMEIEKCLVLCSNCHRELHANIITCPPQTLNKEKLQIQINKRKIKEKNKCCDCGTIIYDQSNRCLGCSDIKRRKFNPSKDELIKLLEVESYANISKIYNVSFAAIVKRCKKYGIYKKIYNKEDAT